MRRMLLLLVLATASCHAGQPAIGPQPSSPSSNGPKNSHGLLLADARERALQMEELMTREQVQAVLGMPDETATASMGGAEGVARWTGLQWSYIWTTGPYSQKRFVLTFQHPTGTAPESANEWYLNSWQWFDF
jgi:hypothetical protein